MKRLVNKLSICVHGSMTCLGSRFVSFMVVRNGSSGDEPMVHGGGVIGRCAIDLSHSLGF